MFVKTVCEQSDVGHVPTVKSRYLNLFFELTDYNVRSQQRCNGMKGAYVMFIFYILISDVDLRETTMQGEDQGLQWEAEAEETSSMAGDWWSPQY